MKQVRNSLGFDIGTSKLRIFKNGKLIAEKPTFLKYQDGFNNKLIINGKIADLNGTESFLRKEIKKILKPILGFFYPPFISLVSVPSDMSDVSLTAFRDAMNNAGAKSSFLLNDCFIAATGLDLKFNNTTYMIVDFGAGKTSITTISGLEIVKNDILNVASNNLDEAIQVFVKRKYDLLIDLSEAERLKIRYSDFKKNNKLNTEVKIIGKDKNTNIFKNISIPTQEISECLKEDLEFIVDRIMRHYNNLEIIDAEQIKTNGVYLIGGGFKLSGVVDMVAQNIKVSNESYKQNYDYMKIGLEKIQINPSELYDVMMK